MLLPEDFVFSQGRLQDFVDCEYRFLLKHIHQMEWPAVETEPVLLHEEKMLLGQQFHLLVHQLFSGIEAGILTGTIQNQVLLEWWQQFLSLEIPVFQNRNFSEYSLSIPFMGFRLTAKYDLIHIGDDGELTIFDWKTSPSIPPIKRLLNKLQTKVYLFLLSQKPLVSQRTEPWSAMRMVYWFPSGENNCIEIRYSHEKMLKDQVYLEDMINQILAKKENDFQKTSIQTKCAFCRYRSFCERGIVAGLLLPDDLDALNDDPFQLDFESL